MQTNNSTNINCPTYFFKTLSQRQHMWFCSSAENRSPNDHCGYWTMIMRCRDCHKASWINRPNSQIPQCTCPISHNEPFRIEICTFLFWLMHCGVHCGTVHCEICEIGLCFEHVLFGSSLIPKILICFFIRPYSDKFLFKLWSSIPYNNDPRIYVK